VRHDEFFDGFERYCNYFLIETLVLCMCKAGMFLYLKKKLIAIDIG
jgi:hypothetical protein